MTLQNYLQPLLETISDKRNQTKTLKLSSKILSKGKKSDQWNCL